VQSTEVVREYQRGKRVTHPHSAQRNILSVQVTDYGHEEEQYPARYKESMVSMMMITADPGDPVLKPSLIPVYECDNLKLELHIV
jgi:hypothetical protein